MSQPCLLLCPQFTELEWAIAPRLREWAEVATFDAPGVGDEPMPEGQVEELTRQVIVDRGLQELDERGWDAYFVCGDGRGTATAVQIALERSDQVLGLALGHASLSYESEGERAPLNAAVYDAMGQLLRNDYDSFVRHGITQMTRGGVDEATAQRMVDRFPPSHIGAKVWELLVQEQPPIGDWLRELRKPLLLAKHDGCLGFTSEGYEDALMAFPSASTVVCSKTCCSDPAFAEALRKFCDDVLRDA